jgi:hypothetical protein
MKNLIKTILIILSLTLYFACKKSMNCPKGMHEYKLDNGQTICIPDDLDVK